MKIMCMCANPEGEQKEIHGSSSWAVIRGSDGKNNVLMSVATSKHNPAATKERKNLTFPEIPMEFNQIDGPLLSLFFLYTPQSSLPCFW